LNWRIVGLFLAAVNKEICRKGVPSHKEAQKAQKVLAGNFCAFCASLWRFLETSTTNEFCW
jgi:hypothetical protein